MKLKFFSSFARYSTKFLITSQVKAVPATLAVQTPSAKKPSEVGRSVRVLLVTLGTRSATADEVNVRTTLSAVSIKHAKTEIASIRALASAAPMLTVNQQIMLRCARARRDTRAIRSATADRWIQVRR